MLKRSVESLESILKEREGYSGKYLWKRKVSSLLGLWPVVKAAYRPIALINWQHCDLVVLF